MAQIIWKIGDLELNTDRRLATRGNQPLHLRKKEWQLLLFLMEHPGKVLTREVILDHVWPETASVFPNVVNVHIKYLRDKIDRPFPKHLIKTVYGWGYTLEI